MPPKRADVVNHFCVHTNSQQVANHLNTKPEHKKHLRTEPRGKALWGMRGHTIHSHCAPVVVIKKTICK